MAFEQLAYKHIQFNKFYGPTTFTFNERISVNKIKKSKNMKCINATNMFSG